MINQNLLVSTPIRSQRPTVRNISKKKWTFSFKFWNQIEYFGLDKEKPEWFVSLITRLKELSKYTIDEFESNHVFKQDWRYHVINWDGKNVPIQRSELDWIEDDYLNNDVEYPFYQFQISLALGRIIGFWDENKVFHIVLLDSQHNIQPSRRYNYKIDDCYPLSCKYTSLLAKIEKTLNEKACVTCTLSIDHLLNEHINKNVMIHFIDDELKTECDNIIESKKAFSITDILETGIIYLSDKN